MKLNWLLLLQFLQLTPLGQAASDLQKDLADGKITVEEGAELAIDLVPVLETYLPNQKPELELVMAVAKAVDAYVEAKAAAQAAAAKAASVKKA